MASNYSAIRERPLWEPGDDWLQSLLAEQYSERTHFIFELLQNAQDAGATRVDFSLLSNQLEVRHNGRDFDRRDVEAICAIGKSTKLDDTSMIGRFGIGFKSVYAYTTAPQVHCPGSGEHFEIRDFVQPWSIDPRQPGDEWTTLFVFPLDRSSLQPAESAREIAARLSSLSPRALLFLRHLGEFRWKVAGSSEGVLLREESGDGDARRVQLLHADASREVDEEWLVFDRPVQLVEGGVPSRVELAFLVATDDAGAEHVGTANDTELVAFFPTIVPTHLGFLLQAPFVLTTARDNVREAHPANQLLVTEAGELLVEALEGLRDRGLLDVAALQSLPLNLEAFPEGSLLRPLYDAVRAAMLTRPLLPTADGRHLPAPEIRIARGAGLRPLFSPAQLGALLDLPSDIAWGTPEITATRTPDLHLFLVGRNPQYPWREGPVPALVPGMELDPGDVVSKLGPSFLAEQSDTWMIRLYSWLSGQGVLIKNLRRAEIIRREDGVHVAAFNGELPEISLPPAGKTSYPVVRRSIAADEEALDFFRNLGLTEPDAVDDVLSILPRYMRGRAADGDYASDLERIAQTLRLATGEKRKRLADKLRETPFLIGRNAATGDRKLRRPEALYEPTEELGIFLGGNPEAWLLDEKCLSHSDLWRELGVKNDFSVTRKHANNRGYVIVDDTPWSRQHTRGLDSFDPDFTIHGLDYAVKHPTPELSRVVWNLLRREDVPLRGVVERSTTQDYAYPNREEKVSPVGELTASHAWLPRQDGSWGAPAELSLDDLDSEFRRDEALATRLGMRPTGLGEILKRLKIDADDLEFLLHHPDRVSEVIQSMRLLEQVRGDEWESETIGENVAHADEEAGDAKPIDFVEALRAAFDRPGRTEAEDALGNGRAADPARRQERAVEAVQEARAAEPPPGDRWRVASRKEWEVRDPVVRAYLQQTYGGRCQICHTTFRRRDGQPYFEAYHFVGRTAARWVVDHPGSALCLCATCHAKMRHGSVEPPPVVGEINKLVQNAAGLSDGASIQFELCGEPAEIWFAQRHLIDLGALLTAARSPADEDDN